MAINYLCNQMALQLKTSYYHRWVVFFLDMGLCLLSVCLSATLFYYHKPLGYIVEQCSLHGEVILPLTLLVHVLFRPHMGIVRQTALYDLVKLLVVRFVVLLLGVFWVFNLHQRGVLDYLYSILVVDFLLSALMLISLRLVVKWIFGLLGSGGTNHPQALIFGAGGSATSPTMLSKQSTRCWRS
jgi:FlaA1/EpsC-like NDP-sugar epimerase